MNKIDQYQIEENYLDKEYEIDCDGKIVKMKPKKIWLIYSILPLNYYEVQILGVFICFPNKPVIKKLGSFKIKK